MSQENVIDLYTLQTLLKSGVEDLFPDKLWVKAEISAIKARYGGHCYMELSQSDDNGLIAKATAIIWSSKFRFIAPYFEQATGSPLQEGMGILASVQVNYSQLYGFSLIIDEIDPTYTTGQKELERQATIDRLVREGLMERQQGLSVPDLPYHIAVISAPDAAGYRDFTRHLNENEYGFVVDVRLFEATMQGADAPRSISDALARIQADGQASDIILIMRGGGAKLDLACYDNYDLAAAIARCGIPVMTAIGHDQDFHVADMVAYRHLKTPTAMADEILEYYMAADEQISSFGTRLKLAFVNKISALGARLDLLESRIQSSDPRAILKRGYVLVLNDRNVVVKSSEAVSPQENVSVMFADGTLLCEVKEKKL